MNRSELEASLQKSAQDLGWRINIEDYYKESYNLGSVQQVQVRKYEHTLAEISGDNMEIRLVYTLSKERGISPTPDGATSRMNIYYQSQLQAEVLKYLNTVSQNLTK